MSFWEKIKSSLRSFMVGRNGPDELSFAILIFALVLLLVSSFFASWVLNLLGLASYVWIIFRIFSRNVEKRSAENQKFLAWFTPIQRKLAGRKMQMQDKAHRYYKCPSCGRTLRVPRGRGRIEITCPHCKRKFTKKT